MLYTKEKDGEKWITITHHHVKIDGDGNIIAGLGGKFNGKPVQHAIDHLTSQSKPAKTKSASNRYLSGYKPYFEGSYRTPFPLSYSFGLHSVVPLPNRL